MHLAYDEFGRQRRIETFVKHSQSLFCQGKAANCKAHCEFLLCITMRSRGLYTR